MRIFDRCCCADEQGRSQGALDTSLGRSGLGCSEGDARGKEGQAAPSGAGVGAEALGEVFCGPGCPRVRRVRTAPLPSELRAGFCGHRTQLARVVHPGVSHAVPLVLFTVGVTQGAELAES